MKKLITRHVGRRHAVPARGNDWVSRWRGDPIESILPVHSTFFSNRLPSVDVWEDKKDIKVKIE